MPDWRRLLDYSLAERERDPLTPALSHAGERGEEKMMCDYEDVRQPLRYTAGDMVMFYLPKGAPECFNKNAIQGIVRGHWGDGDYAVMPLGFGEDFKVPFENIICAIEEKKWEDER